MSIYDFIQNEFKSVALNEAKQILDTDLINSLIPKIEKINFGDELVFLEEKLFELEKIEGFTKLKLSNTISYFLLNLYNLDFEIYDIIRIQNLIDKYPDNKLLPLIWVFYQLDAFEEDELLEKDVADFFQVLFDRFGYLIELDNFFEDTDIANNTLNQNRQKQSSELLYPVFKVALKQFPKNIAIKRILGEISYYHKRYQESIDLLLDVLKEIPNNDALDELNRIEIFEFLALNYDKLGNDAKTSEYVDIIMDNIPVFTDANGNKSETIDFSIDAFFLRMRFNAKKGDKEKVREDYNKLKNAVFAAQLEEYEKEYFDVMNFIAN